MRNNASLTRYALDLWHERFDASAPPLSVQWVCDNELEAAESGAGDDAWAMCVLRHGAFYIGVHERIRRAPDYVLNYIILHELLHIELPPKRTKSGWAYHYRAFRIAESMIQTRRAAQVWLDANA